MTEDEGVARGQHVPQGSEHGDLPRPPLEQAKREDALLSSPDPTWTPTPENINALPDPIRRYVHDLETRCDPSGELRELVIARETCKSLSALLSSPEDRPLLSYARLLELMDEFGIDETDALKHRLEDWERDRSDDLKALSSPEEQK